MLGTVIIVFKFMIGEGYYQGLPNVGCGLTNVRYTSCMHDCVARVGKHITNIVLKISDCRVLASCSACTTTLSTRLFVHVAYLCSLPGTDEGRN